MHLSKLAKSNILPAIQNSKPLPESLKLPGIGNVVDESLLVHGDSKVSRSSYGAVSTLDLLVTSTMQGDRRLVQPSPTLVDEFRGLTISTNRPKGTLSLGGNNHPWVRGTPTLLSRSSPMAEVGGILPLIQKRSVPLKLDSQPIVECEAFI